MATTIKLIGYFYDSEYNAICKYSNFLSESNEPYTFKRSTKETTLLLLMEKNIKMLKLYLHEVRY